MLISNDEDNKKTHAHLLRMRKLMVDTREHQARILGSNIDVGGHVDVNAINEETKKKIY